MAQISRFQRSALRIFDLALPCRNTAIDSLYPFRYFVESVDRTFRGPLSIHFLSSSRFPLPFLSFPSTSYFHSTPRYSSATLTFSTMSSSTTSPTPVDSGECVVCGQITTTRCSSCARYGTGWMYFCSKEHQKLVSQSIVPFEARKLILLALSCHFSNHPLPFASPLSRRYLLLCLGLVCSQTNLRHQFVSLPMAILVERREVGNAQASRHAAGER